MKLTRAILIPQFSFSEIYDDPLSHVFNGMNFFIVKKNCVFFTFYKSLKTNLCLRPRGTYFLFKTSFSLVIDKDFFFLSDGPLKGIIQGKINFVYCTC